MLHLPMLQFIMPPNVSNFFSMVLPVAMFDIIESSYSTELMLDFDYEREDEEADEIFGQIKDLGYEQHNSILNLGSIFIFNLVYFVKVLLYFTVVKIISMMSNWGKKLRKKMQKSLFFSGILTLSIEAYMEYLIAGTLNMRAPIYSTNGEYLAIAYGAYSLAVSLFFIPAAQ